jgi:hypothetical protein
LGVIILATQAVKEGGFDGAVGIYEKAISYLKPLRVQLTVPLVLIGFKPCDAFIVTHAVDVISGKTARFVLN